MRIEIMIDKEQKISQSTLDELTGLQLDEERKRVMKIMQKVWEDDSWLH